MPKLEYKPSLCECCGQSKDYLISIDHGTVDIVKAIAHSIGLKGINAVHPRKEIERKYLTSNQVGNLSRPRMHGLIAKVKGMPGNYLLTTKGAKFLRGEPVHKHAIISKAEGHQIGYFGDEMCSLKDFPAAGETYWTGIGYEILEGNVIHKTASQSTLL